MNWIKSHFDNVKKHPKKLATYVSTAFFLFFSWATLSFHDKLPLDDWRPHLRADAAGYYVYLPVTFHFGMKASNVDTSLVESAGKGFSLNREQDIIYTKYTYGTALLMTPFYLVAELIEGYGKTDGWTKTHHQLIEISGIFYLSAGIWLLSSILLGHYRVHQFIVILSIMVAVFGTNLFYYGFRAPAYSHVYSFFLVSSALFCIYPET